MGANESVIRVAISAIGVVFASIAKVVGRCRGKANTDDGRHDDANRSERSQKSYARRSISASGK